MKNMAFERKTMQRVSKALLTTALAAVALASCVVVEDDVPFVREELQLPIPPVMQPTRSDETGDYYTMHQRAGQQVVWPGLPPTTIEGYEGQWPGPTIVARKGRPTHVTQVNQLSRRTVVHNHGHKVPQQSDGHPVDFIEPGASRVYDYPNDQLGGTFWLHDHAMHQTSRNVWRGLAGMYIVQDETWDRLNLPKGKYDIPLVLQDRSFNGDGSLYYPQPQWGNTITVNGVRTPHLKVARRKYMFRVLDGSDHRPFRLFFQPVDDVKGIDAEYTPFTIIAGDGSLTPRPVPKQEFFIGPAERFTLIMDFSQYAVGTSVVLRNRSAPPAPFLPLREVMWFDIDRDEPDDSAPTLPDELLKIERLDPAKADVVRRMEFSRNDSPLLNEPDWFLNGKKYDPARVDIVGKLGQTEVWDIVNSTPQSHTMHLHEIQFQILEYQGAPPSPETQGWKDTFFVGPNETAKIILKWYGFPGLYAYHCHVMGHEDNAMMGQVELVE